MMTEKTVGEILKEQGVMAESERSEPKEERESSEGKISFFGEIKIKQLVMDVEKLKAQIDALREIKFTSDQRIKELAENIGELRSIIFQKDGLVKELESKMKIMQDSVNDIEPKKISKEFMKHEEEIQLSQAKTEKVESMYKDIYKRFEESQKILESIKSVENLKSKVAQMETLVTKSMENKDEVDRLTNKTEKIYAEIEDKIKDIDKLKSGLEKTDDLAKEVAKSVDEVDIKIEGFAKKEDVENFRNTINDMIISTREATEKRIKEIEDALNIPTEEIASKISELQRKKEGVSNLISSLEEQYRIGAVKKETFEEVRDKNEAMASKIDEEIKRMEGQKGLSIRTLPSVINELQESIGSVKEKMAKTEEEIEPAINLESRTYVLETSVERIRNDMSQINPEKLVRMTNAIDTQTEIVSDILTRLKEVNRRLMDTKVNLSDYENRTRFFEIMNILVRVRKVDDIYLYMTEIEKLIFKMRLDKIWTEEKQDLLENLLMELSENWNESGRNDIAKLFKDFLERIRAPRAIR
jgi:chromosome segregation ATPase